MTATWTRLWPVAAVGAAVLVGLTVVQDSDAAFGGSTSNGGNAFGAATVSLATDSEGTVLFNASGMTPGHPVTECTAVQYTGDTTAVDVGLHADVTDGGLARYLNLTVERGTGGSAADCTGFTPDGTSYTGTLEDFNATHGTFADRFGSWNPTVLPQTVTYRITADVASDSLAEGKTTAATFTWEAQSR